MSYSDRLDRIIQRTRRLASESAARESALRQAREENQKLKLEIDNQAATIEDLNNKIKIITVCGALRSIRGNRHVKSISGSRRHTLYQDTAPSGYIYVLAGIDQEGNRRNIGMRRISTPINSRKNIGGQVGIQLDHELGGTCVGVNAGRNRKYPAQRLPFSINTIAAINLQTIYLIVVSRA